MNNTIYLIRHGEVKYPLDAQGRRLVYGPDVNLSNEGRKQIERLGKHLLKDKTSIDVIYTSPYVRALESTVILAQTLGVKETKVVDGFRDVWTPGYVGTSYDNLINIGGNPYERPPLTEDQESIQELFDRITSTFKSIVEHNEGKTIALVGHGDPLRLLYFYLSNPESELPKYKTLREEGYLEKGSALRLILNRNLRILESEEINPNKEGKYRIERTF